MPYTACDSLTLPSLASRKTCCLLEVMLFAVVVAVANKYLARSRPTIQSGTYAYGYDGVEAVDGDYTTSAYAVNSGGPAWWQVDLLSTCIVYNLAVYASETGQWRRETAPTLFAVTSNE